MDIVNEDFFANIVAYITDDYITFKKLSETNKKANSIILSETNFKQIVKEKRDRYHCKMIEKNIENIMRIKLNLNLNKMSEYINKKINNNVILVNKYSTLMNNECTKYLYEIIEYNYIIQSMELDNNTCLLSLSVSKELYNIILFINKYYIFPNYDILEWLKNN